ncbi:lipocalin family protein [Streptomyces justiciae]|uniref:lipocalin family protein n=1 Tax=Streptomyces justiciae TaxID=2780140 RepID=UPI0021193BB0|nr:lipocalin family protein [Streptomyces justiciae]MCW8378732.1 hypothetical protein [Streptomyces justiciae]
MNHPSRRRVLTIGASAAGAMALGPTALSTAHAAERRSSTPAAFASTSTESGVPAFVDASTDLASQGVAGKSDSIYFTSRLNAPGHSFGVLVHTVNAIEHDQRILAISVTDETTGWYKGYQVPVAKEDYTWSTEGLDIKAPGLTWTGDAENMSVQASTPWGELDFEFEAEGPVMNYAGTGEFDMLGERQYEFAIPALRTSGTLTLEGKTYKVYGESWLDRQWGELPLGPARRWTWMNLSLSNGDKVAIWEFVGDKRNTWATVLHPDGAYELVAVKSLAEDASDYWTSPDSGNTYPTRWRVQIPSLEAYLTVRVTGPAGQELATGSLVRFEGTATASGIYQGEKVTSRNYVEMVGDWRS